MGKKEETKKKKSKKSQPVKVGASAAVYADTSVHINAVVTHEASQAMHGLETTINTLKNVETSATFRSQASAAGPSVVHSKHGGGTLQAFKNLFSDAADAEKKAQSDAPKFQAMQVVMKQKAKKATIAKAAAQAVEKQTKKKATKKLAAEKLVKNAQKAVELQSKKQTAKKLKAQKAAAAAVKREAKKQEA